MKTLVLMLMLLAVPAAAQVTHNSAKIKWTATGDDGTVGQASTYDVRFSTSAIDSLNFDTKPRFLAVPFPSAAGATDSVTVTGLQPDTQYWFAIKVADEVPNWSLTSNVIQIRTLPLPDTTPPFRVTDLRPSP